MSRPFSYNDDNFTVINNLLFCHIKMGKDFEASAPIIEVPPAIVKRLLYYTCQMVRVASSYNTSLSYMGAVGIREDTIAKKYFLFSPTATTKDYTYLVGFYLLKDI